MRAFPTSYLRFGDYFRSDLGPQIILSTYSSPGSSSIFDLIPTESPRAEDRKPAQRAQCTSLTILVGIDLHQPQPTAIPMTRDSSKNQRGANGLDD